MLKEYSLLWYGRFFIDSISLNTRIIKSKPNLSSKILKNTINNDSNNDSDNNNNKNDSNNNNDNYNDNNDHNYKVNMSLYMPLKDIQDLESISWGEKCVNIFDTCKTKITAGIKNNIPPFDSGNKNIPPFDTGNKKYSFHNTGNKTPPFFTGKNNSIHAGKNISLSDTAIKTTSFNTRNIRSSDKGSSISCNTGNNISPFDTSNNTLQALAEFIYKNLESNDVAKGSHTIFEKSKRTNTKDSTPSTFGNSSHDHNHITYGNPSHTAFGDFKHATCGIYPRTFLSDSAPLRLRYLSVMCLLLLISFLLMPFWPVRTENSFYNPFIVIYLSKQHYHQGALLHSYYLLFFSL